MEDLLIYTVGVTTGTVTDITATMVTVVSIVLAVIVIAFLAGYLVGERAGRRGQNLESFYAEGRAGIVRVHTSMLLKQYRPRNR